jgi:mono/diheme cytochrome c family protein
MRPAILTLVLTTALFAAGCGAVNHIPTSEVTPANASEGKALFVKNCAACHTLADAKTTGTIGPNLDDAFRYDKLQGFKESTIRDVVRGQIAYATSDPGVNYNGAPVTGMPDNILRGQQARDVAIYVAECSANTACGVQAAAAPSD